MTTRRLRLPGPLPPRGRSGRFGLPPLAICLLSVKTCECRIDADVLAQHPCEPPLRLRPLEADEAPAGVRAAPGRLAAGDEHAVPRREPLELALRRAAAAARAAPDRLAHVSTPRSGSPPRPGRRRGPPRAPPARPRRPEPSRSRSRSRPPPPRAPPPEPLQPPPRARPPRPPS